MVLSPTWKILEGKGNTPLQVLDLNDDAPQLLLKDVTGSNVLWEGQFV
jgi:hypothetical protein